MQKEIPVCIGRTVTIGACILFPVFVFLMVLLETDTPGWLAVLMTMASMLLSFVVWGFEMPKPLNGVGFLLLLIGALVFSFKLNQDTFGFSGTNWIAGILPGSYLGVYFRGRQHHETTEAGKAKTRRAVARKFGDEPFSFRGEGFAKARSATPVTVTSDIDKLKQSADSLTIVRGTAQHDVLLDNNDDFMVFLTPDRRHQNNSALLRAVQVTTGHEGAQSRLEAKDIATRFIEGPPLLVDQTWITGDSANSVRFDSLYFSE